MLSPFQTLPNMKKSPKSPSFNSEVSESFLRFLRQRVRAAYLIAPAAFALGFTPLARAATLDWDPAVTGGTTLGGAGTWDNVGLSNWWDGVGVVQSQWNSVNGDVARFGGTPGTGAVVIGAGVNANGLVFSTGGYTLSGATLTLDDPNATLLKPLVQVTNLADTATISAVLAGTVGFEKTGAGTLVLSGANTISGGITLTAGTLKAAATGAAITNTGTGVTTAANNNPLGTGPVSLAGGILELNGAATLTPGLSGRVFSAAPLNNDSTNVVWTGAATSTRWDANLNRYDLTSASGGGTALSPTTSVAAQWTGKVQITGAGNYRFFAASDDGSRVFVDGVLVTNNDGSKGTTDLGGITVPLSAGLHDIRFDYTQGGGGGAAILSYAGPDTSSVEVPIPASALFTAEANTTSGSSNALIYGAGTGSAVTVNANSTINLSGTATQAQVGGLTNLTGTTLTVGGAAGKTLRLAGASTVSGSLTIDTTPDVAFDGTLAGVGATINKLGTGRVVFGQTAVANTIDAASTLSVQNGTAVLIGGANNPLGAAGIQLAGGNLVIDSKGGPQTYANAITVTQNGTIQSIVSGASATTQPIQTLSGAISLAATKTLTFDAISGGVTTANIPTGASGDLGAQINATGIISGAGNLAFTSTSYGNVVNPGTILLTNAGNTFSGSVTINGTTFVGNTSVPVNGPTLRPTVAGALPSTATTVIVVKSGILDFATNNVAYSQNAANAITLGGGPVTTTSNINIGTGVLTLNNDIVFDASTNSGVATIKGNGAATGILDLNTAGQRNFNVGDSSNAPYDLVVTPVINATGGGGLTKSGPGTMALQANVASQNTGYTGLTQVSGGTLVVGGGALGFAGDGAIKGNITVDAAGTYRMGAGNIIVNTSLLTINGKLDLNGFQETVGSLAGNGVVTASVGNLGTGGSFLSLDMPANTLPFTGSVTGFAGIALGGRLTTAPVTVATSQFSALTYFGDTVVGDMFGTSTTGQAITLQLSADNALPFGYSRGDLRVMGSPSGTSKGIFDLNGFNQRINGLISAGAVQAIITNNGASDSTLTFGDGANSVTSNASNAIIQNGATNTVNLVKIGLGTQTLSAANTFTGTTTINGGRLAISHATALGTTAGGTTVNAGGYLDIVNVTSAEPLTLNGKGQPLAITLAGTGGAMYSGALVGSGGIAGVQSGNITLGSDTSIGVAKGNALTISGVISGAFGLTKTLGDVTTGGAPATIGAAGTLVLTGANTYTGPTTIESGELRLANPGGLAIASTLVNMSNNGAQGIPTGVVASASANGVVLTLGASNQMPSNVVINWNNRALNAKFQLNGFNQTIKGFTGDSGISGIIQNFETGGAGTSVLTVDTAGTDTSFNGRVRDQSGVLAITKAGVGTFTLSGINAQAGNNIIAYTGQTTINGGKLVLQDTTGFVSPIQNNVAGAGGLEFNINYGRALGYGKTITETAATGAAFTKTGKGTLLLNSATNGQVTTTGTIQVAEGTLIVQGPIGTNTILPTGQNVNVAAGAQFDLWGVGVGANATTYNVNVTLNGLTPGGALVIGGVNANSDTTLSGNIVLNATSNVASGWSDHTGRLTGVISGAGGLQIDKQNYTQQPLTLQITNANTYSGGTTINAGTVYFTGATSLPAGGLLTLGGYSTLSSQTSANAGNIVLGTNGLSGFTRALGTASGNVSITGEGGGFSAVGSAQTVNFGGAGAPITWGAAGLDANASLWFNGANALANAGAFVADNVVTVTNNINLGSGMRRVYVVNNNATTADWATFSGVVSGSGGLIKDGGNGTAAANLGGFLVYSGAASNTYTGLTNVIGGAIGLEKTGGAIAIAGDMHVSNLQGGSRRIIYLGGNEQIADNATISFSGQSGQNGDFRLFGFNETVGAIQDRSGGGVVEIAEAGDLGYRGVAINNTLSSTLTVGGSVGSPVNTDSFYNGFLRTQSGGTGVLNLVKNGTGTFTISAGQQSGNVGQTYNGTTVINAGTVLFNNVATLNSPITVNAGANVAFNTNINQSLTEGQIISGAGNLVKSGPGTQILSAANAYSGTTTVNGGTLNITGTTNAALTGIYTVNSNGVLLIGNGTTGGILTANNNIALNGGTLAFSRNNAQTHSGIISGTGNVENRTAGGNITLSGANTYSGTTTVSAVNTLNLGGSGISAGGLFVNAGGTINVDFSQAGSSATNVVASGANVTMTQGNLTLTGAAAGTNTQTLGTVTAGILANQATTFTALTSNVLNTVAGAGGTLDLILGGLNHQVGGALYINLGASTTLNATGIPDGALSGFAYLPANAGFLGITSGSVSATPTYAADTWVANQLVDVTTSSAQAAASTASALRFNVGGNSTVTLSGANTLSTGGILVTPAGIGNNVITGGSLVGSAADGITINQSGAGTLSIGSDLSGTGGLTKLGTGFSLLTGNNTYTGGTVITAGTLAYTGTGIGTSPVSIRGTGILQVGDGTTNGTLPTLSGGTAGIFVIKNGTAQTFGNTFNVAPNYPFLANANSNPTSYNQGVFTKDGPGVLTITNTILANQFHNRAGTTILDSGANILVNGYNSVGQFSGDNAVLTVKGIGRITDSADFNIGDLSGAIGVLNVQDQAVANVGNLYVGKSGVAVGVVNQTFGTVQRAGGSADWRIGGATVADGNAYGAYNLSAGTFTTSVNFQTGAYGKGVWNQTGGTATITGGFPDVGRFVGAVGAMTVTGGVWANTPTTTSLIVGEEGTGVLSIGGTGIVSMLTTSGAGVTGLRLGHIATGNGIANLNAGGTLLTTGVSKGAGTGILNFNGGTLRANTGALAAFVSGLTSANVFAGGANIDTNGLAVTVAQPLLAPAGNGVVTIPVTSGGSGYVSEPIVTISGAGTGASARANVVGGVVTSITITGPGINYSAVPTVALSGGLGSGGVAAVLGTPTTGANATTGGLTKLGAGAMTVTGVSTYGGATTITGGSIISSSALASTNQLPATALVLNGGSLTVTQTAAVVASQTFSSTTISSPAVINGTIFAGGTTNLTLGGITRNAGAAVDFVLPSTGFINTSTASTNGILGGHATVNNGANWAVGGGNIAALATYTANTATTWTAAANTDQTIATTGLVAASTTNSVRFNTATPLTVVQAAGTTSTILSGGILITPTATTAANLFSGGTINSGSTSTDLVFHDYGTAATAFSMVSVIGAGTGGLVKAGPGLIVLSNPTANLYTGATTIGAGTLRVGVTGNFAIPDTSVVTIAAGARLDLNNFSETIGGLAGYGAVTTIAGTGTPTLTLNQASNTTFSGTILNGTSTGTIVTKTGAGTLTLNNLTLAASSTYTGATNINFGAIKLATPFALANNTTINVNVASGLLFDTTIPQISGLGGNSNFALTSTGGAPVQLTIGNNNAASTFNGALTGSGTLIKIGTGLQLLNGANTNAGGVIANAGFLSLNGNNSAAPSAPMIVNTGGTLQIANINAVYGSSGRNITIASGGMLAVQTLSANPASLGNASVQALLNRLDSGSTGVLALETDSTVQAQVSENLDFTNSAEVSLGAIYTNVSGYGTSNVNYTGIITPRNSMFRLGGGGGRLYLPNGATMAGANGLTLFGGGNNSGQVFLDAAYGYTGSTIVNQGQTYITNVANAGTASSLGAATAAASNLVLNGGTMTYIGDTATSTDRLFTLSALPTILESSGTAPVSFTGTGAVAFLNGGNRSLTIQGNNTGTNTINAAFGDSLSVAVANNGAPVNGTTAIIKGGNGTWILGGNNTFSGGVFVNNGLLGFSSASAFGANTVNGPASVLVNGGGAVGLFGSLQTGIQATLNRISPLSTGSIALTADTAEAINFDGGSAGAQLPQAFLGAYGNVAYTGTLTPFANQYRLGGGGGVLTIANASNNSLTGPRALLIGGGGPGTNLANNPASPGAGFVTNPNLNGAVVLGGSNDFSGGVQLLSGGILSATNLAALGSGPLKFQGGVYRAIDATDISLASDGVTARDIRIGADTATVTGNANIDVIGGVNLVLSKAFGTAPTYGSNQGQDTMIKYGAGTLTLAGGLNLTVAAGAATPTNTGALTIERGTFILGSNPASYAGQIRVGSDSGGVATLKLGGNNVYGSGATQYTAGSVVEIYSGSNLDLAGYSDSLRMVRGMGNIINTGASSANITLQTNNEVQIIGGNLSGNFTLTVGGNNTTTAGGAANTVGVELWNNYNSNFTGKLVVNGNSLRIRGDGTLGSTTEPFAADKITLNNGATLIAMSPFAPITIGANHGITIGANGGTLSAPNTNALIVNSPISGTGMLTIGDETGAVFLGNSNNTYAGGTTISSVNARGYLAIGTGGTTGNLPGGDVFFNTAAGGGRLYFFRSDAMTVPNTLNGGGLVLQLGGGTTTLTGNNFTNQTTFVGGGRLKVDFSTGNAPIGTGTGVTINGGAFEYVTSAANPVLRLGTLNLGGFTGAPNTGSWTGGLIGDSVVQSTYNGTGTQVLEFSGNSRATNGSTMNFVTSGAGSINGVNNSIAFSGGVTVNNVIHAAYYYGGEFAAVDATGFVRAPVFGSDQNTSAVNTLVTGKFAKLTTSLLNQGPVQVPGIELVGPGVNLNFASSGNTATPFTMNGNPGAILKSGGGGLAGVSVISGGTMAATINPQVTTLATLNNNGQELILRMETADDFLRVDMPIAGAGQLTKSGNGTLILTAANTFTGSTFINSGTVTVTGTGVLGSNTAGTSLRIANSGGSVATLNIDSATATINAGLSTQGDALRVGEAGIGTLNQSAGTVNANQFLTIGDNLGAVGIYNMTGGTLNVKQNNATTPALVVGRAGTGTLNIGAGSTVNVKNGAQFLLGNGVVNGTAVSFQSGLPNVGINTGVGTVNQTGGNVVIDTNNNAYQSQVFGALILGVDGAGTYNLNGGSLTSPIIARGNGTANFNLGGGTIIAPAVVPTIGNSIFNLSLPIALTGTGGNGTINTNGNNVASLGTLSGAGGLTKAGNGTLTVQGTSTYTGGTTLSAGNIVASGTSLGAGNVNLTGGTLLQIAGVQTGLQAKFVLGAMTQVNPGITTGTSLMQTELTSVSNLDNFLAGKAVIALESTTARGKLSVNYLENGGANGNSSLPPALIALNTGNTPYTADLRGTFNAPTSGDYTFQTRADDAAVVFIDGVPALDNNRQQGFTTRTGTINLTAGPHDIVIAYYNQAGGNGFSVGVTLPNQGQSYLIGNELNMSNALLFSGSNTLAVGSLSGSGNVQLSSTRVDGTLNIGSLISGSDNTDSVFSGNIQGAGSFTKVGTGTQTLSGTNNTYTVATNIQGGTLLLGGNNVLPDTAALNLSTGATLATGGFSDNTGALSVNGAASIDTGAGTGTLNFASVTAWADMLNIWNYTGAAWTPGSDKITFTNTAGIDLDKVNFYGGAPGNFGSLVGSGGGGLIGSELVPVPEPSAIMSLLALFGLAGYKERRRFFHFRK
jgi:fibronectin-binding autotransporter adhesin